MKKKDFCVHGGSATVHPMSTKCFKTKRAALKFMQQERRFHPTFPTRLHVR